MTYTEIGKTKCPACQRSVSLVKCYDKATGPLPPAVSRHLYQEQVELNEVGAPVRLAPGFCPGSLNAIKE